MAKINVPYHNQTSNDIHNDCGVACDQMLIHGYTGQVLPIELYYEELGLEKGPMQSVTNLRKFLGNHGVPSSWVTQMSISRLRNSIDNGIPFIALIGFKPLSDANLTCYQGDFNHFAIVVGYDSENVFIHDPFCPGDDGAFRAVPTNTFVTAWTNLDSPLGAIIPSHKMGEAPTGTHVVEVAVALNVRYGPGTSYSIVGTLYNGQYVTVSEVSGNWGKIGENRWTSMSYLKELENPTPPVPPAPPTQPPEEIEIKIIVPKGVKVAVEEKQEE